MWCIDEGSRKIKTAIETVETKLKIIG